MKVEKVFEQLPNFTQENVNSINFLIKFLYSSFTVRSEIRECRDRDIDMNIVIIK